MSPQGRVLTAAPSSTPSTEDVGLLSEPFSEQRLAQARTAGRPVFVNMTAAWCITCLVNERVALARAAVADAFEARELLYLKGDWTNRDAAITDYLADFGRNGVPLYVYYPPNADPRVLPQILTESILLEALRP
jgi:thiol:disulfide interchange protein DsbD